MKNEFEVYLVGPDGDKVEVLRQSCDNDNSENSDKLTNYDPGLDDPGTPSAHM